MMVMLAPTSVGQTTFGQHDVVLPPQLIVRDRMRVLLASYLCQSNNNLSPRWQLFYGFSTGEFYVSGLSLSLIPCLICWCLLWYLLSAFSSLVATTFTNRHLTVGFEMEQCYGVNLWQAHVTSGDGLWLMPGVHWLAAPPTALSRGASSYSFSGPLTIHQYCGAYSFGCRATQFLHLPNMAGGVFSR